MYKVYRGIAVNALVLFLLSSSAWSGNPSGVDLQKVLQQFDCEKITPAQLMKAVMPILSRVQEPHHLEDAKEAFRMVEDVVQPDLPFYGAMLNAYARTGKSKEAQALFDKMKSKEIKLNLQIMNIMLRAYRFGNDLGGAKRFLDEMWDNCKLEKDLCPDTISYSIVMDGFARAYDPKAVQALFDEFHQKGLKPDREVYGTLIKAYAQVADAKNAQRVFDEMWAKKNEGKKGLTPDVAAHNTLVSAYAGNADWKNARRVMQEMWDKSANEEYSDLVPDKKTYGAVLTAYLNASHLEDGESILDEMKDKVKAGHVNLKPGIDMYAPLISAYAHFRNPVKAEKLLDEMWDKHMDKDASKIPHYAVLNGYAEASNPFENRSYAERANRLFRKMKKRNIQLGMVPVASVLEAYYKADRLDDIAPRLIFSFLMGTFFNPEFLRSDALNLHVDGLYKKEVVKGERKRGMHSYDHINGVPEGFAVMALRARLLYYKNDPMAYPFPRAIIVGKGGDDTLKNVTLHFLKENGYIGEVDKKNLGLIHVKKKEEAKPGTKQGNTVTVTAKAKTAPNSNVSAGRKNTAFKLNR